MSRLLSPEGGRSSFPNQVPTYHHINLYLVSVIENDAEDGLELAREENFHLTSSHPNWSLTFEELKGGRSCLFPRMECRSIWSHTDKVAAKKHYSNQSHLAWDRKMAREAARLPPAVPSPPPRPDLRPTMLITFPPPWRPGPLLFRDSQEDQDDVLFSPLPKGTVIPDSEEDSDITLAHVLAKTLYDEKVQGQKHSLRIILFRIFVSLDITPLNARSSVETHSPAMHSS
ncbi:hypothetical protein NCS52_01223400 [Fusarium sp. LHS14.1]|nr:hypothetical protein NCS52_01223400 [Fusarium sp. LHS14.1]